MEVESIINLSISSLAAAGALYTYIAHTRRLNSQQKEINEYQIKLLKEEEEGKKKALIQCHVIQKTNDLGPFNKIQVINEGKATAYNVMLEVDEQKLILFIGDGILPLSELHPGKSFEIAYHKNSNEYNYCINLIWDDEFKKGENAKQVLNL